MSDLPTGWEWATLGEIGEIQGGIQKQAKRQPMQNAYPFLRVANVPRGRLDLADVHKIELFDGELDRLRLESGDLLVVEGNGSLDQLGRAAMWCGEIPDCVHQNHLIRVRPLSGIDPRFLAAAWNSPVVADQLRLVGASTSGLHTLSVSKLKPIRVPVPPAAEQRRIVATLEDHLSRLDAGRRSLAMARSRGKRFDVAARAAEIDRVDAPHGSLADVVDLIEAGRSFGGSGRPAADDEWGIIKVSAMTWGEFRPTENKVVADASRIEHRFEIQPGDVLVSRANTIDYVGAAVLVRNTRPKLLLSDKSLRLKPASGIDPRWLVEVLSSPQVRQEIAEKSTGNQESMRNISQAALMSVRIPLHTADQQARLADDLAERRAALSRLDTALARAEAAAATLRRSLLAEAFAGRLVPQDPTDEPASVLLDRIRAERAAQPKPRRTRKAAP